MLKDLFDIQPLLRELNEGTLVLTPNNRLAAKIAEAWGQHQDAPVWLAPNVQAIESWINELWLQLQTSAWPGCNLTVVDSAQELLLWEQVIAEDSEKPPLLNAVGLARTAMQASSTLQLWETSNEQLSTYANHEGMTLIQRWQKQVANKLRERQLAHPAERLRLIAEAFASDNSLSTLQRSKAILLVDFQSLSPLHLRLLESAAENVVYFQGEAKTPKQSQLIRCHDSQSELELAAQWAKSLLEREPNSRIGIIIPDLPSRRQQVERLFREAMEPDYVLPSTDRYTAPFNISTATPLANLPMIAAALNLLKLNHYQQPLPLFLNVLKSPFWGSVQHQEQDHERAIRATAATALKKREAPTVRSTLFREICAKSEAGRQHTATNTQHSSLDTGILDLFAELPTDKPLSLAARLNQFEAKRRIAPTTASFAWWKTQFEAQLAIIGWPGERPLDSVEYQQMEHWHLLLERFAALTLVKETTSCNEAITELERLAQTTPFQAETEDSPLQILGLLEGAGLRFDHLWMASCDDRQWPPTPEPSPLLPVELQRVLGMPRACAARELQLAQQLLNTYWQRSEHIVFSYGEFDGDAEYRPSNMITDLVPIETTAEPLNQPTACEATYCQLNAKAMLEVLDDQQAPPLDTTVPVRGGTSLLKDQANCPFNSFVRWRLGARQANDPTLGLSALERGIVLHDLLDHSWEELSDQQQLLALTDEQLCQKIDDISQRVLRPWQARKPELGNRYFQLEAERLAELTLKWLVMEKDRPPFQVAAREAALDVNFAGLPLTLRIDRIDQTPSNETLLIDYKTGNPSLNGWLGERPSDPQLPLYAILQEQPPVAITYGIINAKEQQLVGIAASESLLPSNNRRLPPLPEWQEQLALWRERLTAIADEIKSGKAPLTVYNKMAFEQERELLPLNRWPEREPLQHYLDSLGKDSLDKESLGKELDT